MHMPILLQVITETYSYSAILLQNTKNFFFSHNRLQIFRRAWPSIRPTRRLLADQACFETLHTAFSTKAFIFENSRFEDQSSGSAPNRDFFASVLATMWEPYCRKKKGGRGTAPGKPRSRPKAENFGFNK